MIKNYNNNKQNGIGGAIPGDTPGKSCESCGKTTSSLWYAYGAAHSNSRLCQSCWIYYKKFGGLKYPSKQCVQQDQLDKQQQVTPTTNNGQNSLNNISSLSTSGQNQTKLDSNNCSTNVDLATGESTFKCKECNKSFNRQGNNAITVLNLMVKNKRNDEGDDFNLCNNCLSSKKC